MPIHHLHEPIDVFSEWLDDCEAAAQGKIARYPMVYVFYVHTVRSSNLCKGRTVDAHQRLLHSFFTLLLLLMIQENLPELRRPHNSSRMIVCMKVMEMIPIIFQKLLDCRDRRRQHKTNPRNNNSDHPIRI